MDRRTLALAPGDLVAIVGFLAVGQRHHGVDPVAAPAYFAETALPFLVGWAVAAPLLGVYDADTRGSLRSAWRTVVPAWLLTVLVGQVVRATPLVHGGADPVFALVIGTGGAVLLAAWRGVELTAARLRAGHGA
jgi:hypothetical protein